MTAQTVIGSGKMQNQPPESSTEQDNATGVQPKKVEKRKPIAVLTDNFRFALWSIRDLLGDKVIRINTSRSIISTDEVDYIICSEIYHLLGYEFSDVIQRFSPEIHRDRPSRWYYEMAQRAKERVR